MSSHNICNSNKIFMVSLGLICTGCMEGGCNIKKNLSLSNIIYKKQLWLWNPLVMITNHVIRLLKWSDCFGHVYNNIKQIILLLLLVHNTITLCIHLLFLEKMWQGNVLYWFLFCKWFEDFGKEQHQLKNRISFFLEVYYCFWKFNPNLFKCKMGTRTRTEMQKVIKMSEVCSRPKSGTAPCCSSSSSFFRRILQKILNYNFYCNSEKDLVNARKGVVHKWRHAILVIFLSLLLTSSRILGFSTVITKSLNPLPLGHDVIYGWPRRRRRQMTSSLKG